MGETYAGNPLGGTSEPAGGQARIALSFSRPRSDRVLEEADESKARGILVPVLLDKVPPPRGFRGLQAADLDGKMLEGA
jgi:hypothetical protein